MGRRGRQGGNGHGGNGHGGNGHGGGTAGHDPERAFSEPPPEWPHWEQRIADPGGGLWRVRTVDVLEAPGQLHPRLAKTVAETKGRFRTTVISPGGALVRDIYVPDRDQAVAYHRKVIRQVRAGELAGADPGG